MVARGESQCPHSDLDWSLTISSFGDTNICYLEIKGVCKICEAPVTFRGMPLGMSPMQPTMALDGSETRLPFMFGDEEYDGKAASFVLGAVG